MRLGQPNDPKIFRNVKRKKPAPTPRAREFPRCLFPFLLGHLGHAFGHDPNDPIAGRPRGRRPGAHGRVHARVNA